MNSVTNLRFNPDFARDLLLEIAQERSVENLLQKVVRRIIERPAMACFRIWLVDKGDICPKCPMRSECSDQTRCLHSVASGNKTGSAPCDTGLNGEDCFARIPFGVRTVGKIAATGEPIVVQDLTKDTSELAQVEWVKREKLRGFNGTPIIFQGEMLGVVAGFTNIPVADEAPAWLRVLADHIAGAIVNARAFEQIQCLKGQLELENAYLQEEVVEARAFGDLVGQSAALRQTISQIDLVAPTDASVLILGETGTGKELVAREIHRRSRRKDKPLIRVNCASVPKELYESEFFGHVKGAFTGAIKDRAGRFETANGGTLFLDEIGEVPLELQSKLLRVLQEKHYERVGEDRTRQADVRIIAATNRDLKKEVEAGRFRQDLYYRLNVFPMQVATLKERREDIPLMAKHFIDLSVREMGCQRPRLTRAGVASLQAYDWPGNVRELRNVIERAVILARGGAMEFDLPAANSAATLPTQLRQTGDGAEPEFLTEPELQRREMENLRVILEKTRWKIKGADGAAELLGVKPTTLISRIKKMGLKPVN
ncbi:MAG: fhlA 3 [Pedosphaera sp.]|nr:fhlA 3 [Pedosphaera sp.]